MGGLGTVVAELGCAPVFATALGVAGGAAAAVAAGRSTGIGREPEHAAAINTIPRANARSNPESTIWRKRRGCGSAPQRARSVGDRLMKVVTEPVGSHDEEHLQFASVVLLDTPVAGLNPFGFELGARGVDVAHQDPGAFL